MFCIHLFIMWLQKKVIWTLQCFTAAFYFIFSTTHKSWNILNVIFLELRPSTARREECGAVDRSRGHSVPSLLLSLGRLELRHRHVGGHVLRREAVLGHGQPGREFLRLSFSQWSGERFLPLGLPNFLSGEVRGRPCWAAGNDSTLNWNMIW